ncbi:MAG: hypothetical protein KBE23_04770 [Chloroflexi bacterium]|nr:hypothetical protein [Chloroflexota bacterium]MBP7042031.1 hypothetical protein [Chloroflexota bacterium]
MTYANAPGPVDKTRFLWAATAVLLLAALFRLAALQDVPPGLAQDEVLDADIALFIRGGYNAFFFREGYGHEPLYHYLAVPFAPLLGDNVLAVRLPSVFLGLLLVALTMRWAKREFGGVTAVVAGIGLAVSWWPIIFSRLGIRPILEPVLLVMMAWFWPRRPWLAGLFLGLSLYSYTGARVVFLIPILFAAYWLLLGRRGQARFPSPYAPLKTAVIVLLMAGLVSLPLFLTLRADPTLQQRVDQLAGPLAALRQGDLKPVLQNTLQTIGVFSFTGDPRWTYSWPGRPLFDWVTAMLFYAGLGVAFWRLKRPNYAFTLIWLAVGLLPSAITPQAPSTVRLVGAMSAVYVLPGLAAAEVVRLARKRPSPLFARVLLPGVLTAVLLLNMALTIRDGFIRWPQAHETRLDHYQSVLLDISRHVKTNPAAALVLADSFYEPIDRDTFRRDLGQNPAARWVQTGAQVSGAVVIPQREEGENGRFYVPEFAPVNPILLAAAGITAEPVYRSDGYPSFAAYDLPRETAVPSLPIPISFEGVIDLVGFTIRPSAADEPLQLVTVWRVVQPLPADLTMFSHVVDAAGNLAAQHDGFDAAPAELQPGDLVVQLHTITWPSIDGPAALQIGLYTSHDGQRLRRDGGPPDDMVVLAQDIR